MGHVPTRRGSNHPFDDDAISSLRAFSHTSALGFGISDAQLRYRSVNTALATSNGVLPEAHIGNTVHEVLGRAAVPIIPVLRDVMRTGRFVSKKIAGQLPSREGTVHWIAHYFPVKQAGKRTHHVGVLAVDITDFRRLATFLSNLGDNLLRAPQRDNTLGGGRTAQSNGTVLFRGVKDPDRRPSPGLACRQECG
jgi:PAS fold